MQTGVEVGLLGHQLLQGREVLLIIQEVVGEEVLILL